MRKYLPMLILAGGLALTGCGDSNNDFVFTGGNSGIPLAPIARNDAFSTDEGDALVVADANGVLTNDTLNAGPNSNITVTFPATTEEGGTVTLGSNFGGFTYTPAAGFVGTDTFIYSLSNSSGAPSTAIVTITVDAVVPAQGYFVDAANGNDATGNFGTGSPYATIQAAVAAAPVDGTVTVRPGTYAGDISLKNGQSLLGVASGTRPVLTGTVTLGDGNTLEFLRFEDTDGNAVDGDDQDGGTIRNCEFFDTTNLGNALQADSVTGTWVIEDNVITNVAGLGIQISTDTGDNVVAQVNGNVITGNDFDAIGFLASDNSTMRIQANDNVMTDNQDGFTFEVIIGGTSNVVLQIAGNTNDDTYRFRRNTTTASLQVERFDQLLTINDGGMIDDPDDEVDSVANGAAGFGTAP